MAQLSNRYAAAIFQLALARGDQEGAEGGLRESLNQALMLRDVMKEEECQTILTHPRISGTEKKSFLDEAFKNHVNVNLMGLLYLVVDKGREEFIVPILNEFIDMANTQLRKATALVVSAYPLKNEQRDQLAALLSRKLDKQVEIDVKVNPSVIGGLYIQVDGRYIDRTVKTRLLDLKEEMHEVTV